MTCSCRTLLSSRLQDPAPLGHALRFFLNNTSPPLVTLCLTETLKRGLSSAARAQDKFGPGNACHRYNRDRAKDLNAIMAHDGLHQPCYTTLTQLASGTPCPRLLPAVRLSAAMLHVSCRDARAFLAGKCKEPSAWLAKRQSEPALTPLRRDMLCVCAQASNPEGACRSCSGRGVRL